MNKELKTDPPSVGVVLQNLQLIRAMLGGLLLHSQASPLGTEPDQETKNALVLTAQVANGCLRNLRDSGEECWPRWINGLTLPREFTLAGAQDAYI